MIQLPFTLRRRVAPGMQPTETRKGFCLACGHRATFSSYEPLDTPCKRNTFVCDGCASYARQRHVAKVILDRMAPASPSLRDFARTSQAAIWLAETTGAICDALAGMRRLTRSEYFNGGVSGRVYDGILCQDVLGTTFETASLDLVITQDVLEHVPTVEKAWLEIGRILKPGGYHIGTIPINWSRSETAIRASIVDGQIVHHLEPEYHGDPVRAEGILAFTDYGTDFQKFCELVGPTQILAAHGDRELEDRFGIFNNWVFCSQKPM